MLRLLVMLMQASLLLLLKTSAFEEKQKRTKNTFEAGKNSAPSKPFLSILSFLLTLIITHDYHEYFLCLALFLAPP